MPRRHASAPPDRLATVNGLTHDPARIGERQILNEFRAFIMRGNVMDLAVAVIIGAAFAAIVKSLTDDVLMPIIGAVTGGLDFNEYYTVLGPIPEKAQGLHSYAELKKAGVPLLGYGAFITNVVSFIILAAIIFLMIRAVTRVMKRAMPVPTTPPDVVVLEQILAELKARPIR